MHLIKFQYSILIFGTKLLNLSESECSHLLKKRLFTPTLWEDFMSSNLDGP